MNNSWEITLPELGDILMGGSGNIASNFTVDGQTGLMAAIRKNVKENGWNAMTQIVAVPIAFKIGRKLLRKPLINPTNRVLKQVGLDGVKL